VRKNIERIILNMCMYLPIAIPHSSVQTLYIDDNPIPSVQNRLMNYLYTICYYIYIDYMGYVLSLSA